MKLNKTILINMTLSAYGLAGAPSASANSILSYANEDQTCILNITKNSKGEIVEFEAEGQGLERDFSDPENIDVEELSSLVDAQEWVSIQAAKGEGLWKVVSNEKKRTLNVSSTFDGIELDENNKPIKGKSTLSAVVSAESSSKLQTLSVTLLRKIGKRLIPWRGLECQNLSEVNQPGS